MSHHIYLRHGEKAYANGKSPTFPLDPPLTEDGRLGIVRETLRLYNIYGLPPAIITSPYLRCRETANIIQLVLYQHTRKIVDISVDRILSECLTHQRGKYKQSYLQPETLAYKPFTPESWPMFASRVRKHFQTETECAWFITHGAFITELALCYDLHIIRPQPMAGIAITDGVAVKI